MRSIATAKRHTKSLENLYASGGVWGGEGAHHRFSAYEPIANEEVDAGRCFLPAYHHSIPPRSRSAAELRTSVVVELWNSAIPAPLAERPYCANGRAAKSVTQHGSCV